MSQNVITDIPAEEAMHRQYGPKGNLFSGELLPRYYTEGIDHTTTPTDASKMVLGKLRNELHFGNREFSEEFIKTTYGIARGIGDRFIAEVSPDAFQLLSFSRSNGESFGMVFRDSSGEDADSLGGVSTISQDGLADRVLFDVKIGEVSSGSNNFKIVENNLHALGANVLAEDISLFIMLKTVAHEAGHVIQRGVGRLIRPNEHPTGSKSYDVMSSELLKSEPQLAQTMHEYTSVRVHNERFAEGYARIVLREAASALGYDAATIDKIARALSAGNLDQTLQQHLDAVTKEKSYAEVAGENGLEDAYDGDLGYALPLSPEQVILDLEYTYAKRFDTLNDDLRAKIVASYGHRGADTDRSLEGTVSSSRKRRTFGKGVINAIRQRFTRR